MMNINNKTIIYTTNITDKLYYLLPLELFLSFLWGLFLAGIWFINQVSTIISWDAWGQIRNNFQIGQSLLFQTITIVMIIYLLAHILLCIVWIKEDKFLNFIRTLNLLRIVRKQMLSETKMIDSDVLKNYKSIIYSIRCILTLEYIYVIIPQAESSDIDTILQKKLPFLYDYLIRVYRKIYIFSPTDSTSLNHIIRGTRKHN